MWAVVESREDALRGSNSASTAAKTSRPQSSASRRDGQRWREADHRPVRVLGQHATLGESLDDGARRDVRREFDAGPQSAPAHGADQRRAQVAQSVEQVRTELTAALDEFLVLDDAQRLERHARRERIAAEGRTVASRAHQVEHGRARDEGGNREQAAAQGLADDDGVGTDAFVHVGEPRASAAESRLDLVDDQQDVARGAQFARGAQEARAAA